MRINEQGHYTLLFIVFVLLMFLLLYCRGFIVKAALLKDEAVQKESIKSAGNLSGNESTDGLSVISYNNSGETQEKEGEEDTITVHYSERPPYYVTGIFDVYGICADPAKKIFRHASIKFRWEKTPAGRQIEILKENRGKACLLGWFRNSERETYAKFSLPIYRDRPAIAIAKSYNREIIKHGPRERYVTVEEFLLDRKLTLLVKSGYSYGKYVDGKISTLKPPIIVTTDENIEMIKMIYNDRADYFFISEEEAQDLVLKSGLTEEAFSFIKFSDMPEGNSRHLMFSRSVDDETVEKIDSAIRFYGYERAVDGEKVMEKKSIE